MTEEFKFSIFSADASSSQHTPIFLLDLSVRKRRIGYLTYNVGEWHYESLLIIPVVVSLQSPAPIMFPIIHLVILDIDPERFLILIIEINPAE